MRAKSLIVHRVISTAHNRTANYVTDKTDSVSINE